MRLLTHSIITLLGTASLASATLVSFDYNVTGSSGPNATFAGTGPLGGGTWNGVSVARSGSAGISNVTATSLLDSTGAVTPLTITVGLVNNAIGAGNQANVADSMDPLFSEGLYLFSAQNATTITISGLPASVPVSLVLFAADTRNEGSNFAIGATTASSTDAATIGTTLTRGTEYAQFDAFDGLTGIQSSPAGTVTINWTIPSGHSFASLEGMQIQYVPEPTAATLGIVGLAGLVGLRRRRG